MPIAATKASGSGRSSRSAKKALPDLTPVQRPPKISFTPLVGGARTTHALSSLGAELDAPRSHSATGRSSSAPVGVWSRQDLPSRPQTTPCTVGNSSARALLQQSDTSSVLLSTYNIDFESLSTRASEIEAVATSTDQPSKQVTAMVCMAVSQLTHAKMPHHELLRDLLQHLETATYAPDGLQCGQAGIRPSTTGTPVDSASRRNAAAHPSAWNFADNVLARQADTLSTHCAAEMPSGRTLEASDSIRGGSKILRPSTTDAVRPSKRRYAGRTPYFSLVRQQLSRVLELRRHVAYLQKVIRIADGLKERASLLCAMSRDGVNEASYLWVFAFWKIIQEEMLRNKRKKAELVFSTSVGDTLQPFMHWRMFVMDVRVETLQQTQRCFTLEKQLLSVEVKHLEIHFDDVRVDLATSSKASERLAVRHAEADSERARLAGRLEAARPDFVRRVLCQVLDVLFARTLQEAQLSAATARMSLEGPQLSLLLQQDEESISRLKTVSAEGLVVRWANHHISHFRIVASEILESNARHRSEESGGPQSTVPSEWSLRDTEKYCDRCRVVRDLHRVQNVGEDLRDGTVLATVYASLASASHGQGVLNPAALWVLDERDPEVRAVKLCNALREMLRARAAQCLLTPQDISTGNVTVLLPVLASLFLQGSSSEALSATSGSGGRFFATTSLAEKDEETQMQAAYSAKVPRDEGVMNHVLIEIEAAASACAYDSLQDLSVLLEDDEGVFDLARLSPNEFLLRWLNFILDRDSDSKIENFTELKGGQILKDVLYTVAGDVFALLPQNKLTDERSGVIDVVIEVGARCTNFGILTKEALQEGHGDILAAFIAGLFLGRPSLPVSPDSPLQQHVQQIEAVVRRAYNVQSEESDAGNAEGSGFTGLCVWMQRKQQSLRQGLRTVQDAQDLQNFIEKRMHSFLADLLSQRARGSPFELLEDKSDETPRDRTQVLPNDRLRKLLRNESVNLGEQSVNRQASVVEDMLRKHSSLFRDIFQHYGHLLTFGAKGLRNASVLGVDVDEGRPSSSVTLGGAAGRASFRSRSGRVSVSVSDLGTSIVSGRPSGGRPSFGGGAVATHALSLRSLVRIFKDCQLRGPGLTPSDVEAIFRDLSDHFIGVSGGIQRNVSIGAKRNPQADSVIPVLTFEGFLEALLRFACRVPPMAGGFAEQFGWLVEKRLWVFACRPSSDDFYNLAYGREISDMACKLDRILRAIFQAYIGAGPSSTHSSTAPTRRMSIGASKHLMTRQGLESLVEDGDLTTGQLDKEAVGRLYVGAVLTGEPHMGPPDESSGDDQPSLDKWIGRSEVPHHPRRDLPRQTLPVPSKGLRGLSFLEFLDALIAIVLHCEPSPFTPIDVRFERLVRCRFAPGLRSHIESVQEKAEKEQERDKERSASGLKKNAMANEKCATGSMEREKERETEQPTAGSGVCREQQALLDAINEFLMDGHAPAQRSGGDAEKRGSTGGTKQGIGRGSAPMASRGSVEEAGPRRRGAVLSFLQTPEPIEADIPHAGSPESPLGVP